MKPYGWIVGGQHYADRIAADLAYRENPDAGVVSVDEALAALKELTEACAYVQPISGTMDGSTVKNMRKAFRFMTAVEKAQAIIDQMERSAPLSSAAASSGDMAT